MNVLSLSKSAPRRSQPVRHVFRDTQTYAQTLHASYHPRFQRDAIACEAMLRDALRVTSDDGLPWLKVLEEAEAADLLACDIPYFFSRVGDTEVFGTEGQKTLAVGDDAWRNCRAQIEAMGEVDLDLQTSLIRVAMFDKATETTAPRMTVAGPPIEPSSQTLIATAARIGDRICELAIEDGDRCT